MKTYEVTPARKKSLIETRFWVKATDDGKIFAEHETGWRSGTFIISVPETDEEIKQWLDDRDMELDDMQYTSFLPKKDDEVVDLSDYDFEISDTWDGCWEEWRLSCYPENILTGDQLSTMTEEVEKKWQEDWEETLINDGWEELGSEYAIHGGVIIEECE